MGGALKPKKIHNIYECITQKTTEIKEIQRKPQAVMPKAANYVSSSLGRPDANLGVHELHFFSQHVPASFVVPHVKTI